MARKRTEGDRQWLDALREEEPWTRVLEKHDPLLLKRDDLDGRLLLNLCRAALQALIAEDAALCGAFEKNERLGSWPKGYGARDLVSRGLAYWLYETTLVYVIYKAWLPLAHVAWEYNPKHDKASTKLPRPDESPQGKKPAKGPGTVDLAVLNKQGTQKWLFEAKWWRSSKDTALVARDAGKLGDRRFGKKVNGRFLLTFWYSWQEKRWTGKYPTGEIAFLQRLPRRVAGKAKPVFLGAFPADCRWEKKKLGDRYKPYFAMAVLEVNGAKKKRSRGA